MSDRECSVRAGARLETVALECVRGERRLFRGVGFALARGELMHVAGANGTGKTSLLRILCGLSAPAAGDVRWGGESIRTLREAYYAQLIYLGHAAALKDDLTALENVRMGAALAGQRVTDDQARAALAALGVERTAPLHAGVLSQGQRRRVALTRLVLGAGTPLWILDEPFTALDVRAVSVVEGAIEAHLARGGIAVVTTHQEVALLARAARRLDLDRGEPC